jgi:CrcB protein
MTLLFVALGAGLGAPARYLIDRAIQRRHRTAFPWGTFGVNILASVVLGFVTGAAVAGSANRHVQAFIGLGLCGALSTYSTFAFETLRLSEEGSRWVAAANAVASVVGAVGAAFLGAAVASAIWA